MTNQTNKTTTALFTIVIAIFLIAVWSTQQFPYQDWNDWLLQSKVFAELIQHNSTVSQWYLIVPNWIIVPNSLLTIIMGTLQIFVTTETAGKIVLSLYGILFPLIFYKTVNRLSPGSPFRFLGLLWINNYFLAMGFLNYLFGMTVLIAYLPRIINPPVQLWRRLSELLAISLLIYSFHGFPFGVFVILQGIVALRLLVQKEWRSAGTIAVALTPTLILLFIYVTQGNDKSGSIELYQSLSHFIRTMIAPALLFQRYEPFSSPLPLSILNLLILTVIPAVLIFSRKAISIQKQIALFLIPLLIPYLFSPIAVIGNFYPPNQRFFPIVVTLFLVLFSFKRRVVVLEYALLVTALLIGIVQGVTLHAYSSSLEKIATQLPKPHNGRFATSYLASDSFDKRTSAAFSIPIRSTQRLSNVLHFDSISVPVAIQETGLIDMYNDSVFDPDTLNQAQTSDDFREVVKRYQPQMNTYEELVIITPEITQRVLQESLDSYEKIRSEEQWILLKRKRRVKE